MDLVADATLAAAVSRAGGLGILGGGFGEEAWLARELDRLDGRRGSLRASASSPGASRPGRPCSTGSWNASPRR
jgi:NAD(P)H-dependent flavin oxidoreductase YrpB (nitropropane dioxygenase family)